MADKKINLEPKTLADWVAEIPEVITETIEKGLRALLGPRAEQIMDKGTIDLHMQTLADQEAAATAAATPAAPATSATSAGSATSAPTSSATSSASLGTGTGGLSGGSATSS